MYVHYLQSGVFAKNFGFGPGFGWFVDKQFRSSGFLEGFERVQSSVLVDKPEF